MSALTCLMLLASAELLQATQEVSKEPSTCSEASNAGVTVDRLAEIAHVLHSITVEDVQYFFAEDFPINNTIPTANQDLSSEDKVLPFAPSIPSEYGFPSGRSFDFILQNNDDITDFMISGMSTLEKLGHAIHMHEMWHMISMKYKQLKEQNIDLENVCPCLEDEEGNGIIEALENFAELARKGMPVIDDLDSDDVMDQFIESNSVDETSQVVKRETMRSFGDKYWPKKERAKRETMRSFGDKYWPSKEISKRETMRSFGDKYWPKKERAKRETMRSFGDKYWPKKEMSKRDTMRSFGDKYWITGVAKRDTMRSFGDKYWPKKERSKRETMRSFGDKYWPKKERSKRETMRSFGDKYWPKKEISKRDTMRSFGDKYWITGVAKRDTMRSFGDKYWPKKERAKRETMRSFGDKYWPSKEISKRETMRSFGDNYWPSKEISKRETMRSFGDNYWIREVAKREADSGDLDFDKMVPELKDSKSWYYWNNVPFKMMHDEEFMMNAAMYFFCKINNSS